MRRAQSKLTKFFNVVERVSLRGNTTWEQLVFSDLASGRFPRNEDHGGLIEVTEEIISFMDDPACDKDDRGGSRNITDTVENEAGMMLENGDDQEVNN